MSSELIINSSRDKSRIGLLKDKKLVEFHQESDETKFNVGDIYVGKVKKINKSLNAAFIDIGFEKDAFSTLLRFRSPIFVAKIVC